ncbi:MAG: hypothetical protein U0871_14770 [Gemmataceae bacterium]
MPRLSACLLLLAAVPAAAADYPHVTLKVNGAGVTVFTPDPEKGFYRGSRFAWAGVVKDLKFGGHTLFGPWKDKHDPRNNDDITGPAEEFGMFSPLGYDEAKVGGRFVKIGVGELEKPQEDKYSFFTNYKVVNPGVWRVSDSVSAPGVSAVTVRQTLRSQTGYSYYYKKRFELLRSMDGVNLYLRHELVNVGDKPFDTDVYNHNFFNVDADPVGPNYSLTFPEAVHPAADFKIAGVAKFAGNVYTFDKPLSKESPFGLLVGSDGKPLQYNFELGYAKNGRSLRVSVDGGGQPVSKFQTWSVPGCLCPEPFSPIRLAPGEAVEWLTTYQVK